MGKKIPTFEERRAQLLKNNQTPTPAQAQAPTVVTRQQVEEGYKPWSQQPDADVYWAGMTEREWSDDAIAASDDVWDNAPRRGTSYGGWRQDQEGRVRAYFPDMENDELTKFIDFTERGRRRPDMTRHHLKGVPNAGASETPWVNNLNLSGKNAVRGNTGSVTDVDLFVNNEGWDVQDVLWKPGEATPRYNLGVYQNLNTEEALKIWKSSPPGRPIGSILKEIRVNSPDIRGDKLTATGEGKHKRMLIGSVKRQEHIRNIQSEISGRDLRKLGTFDPQVGVGEYMLDLDGTREKLPGMTKGQFQRQGGDFRFFNDPDTTRMKLNMPLTNLQRMSGSKGLIEKHVNPDVLKHMDDIGIEKGIRTPGGTRFHGTFLPTDSGPKLNLKSGARMAGEKVVKGGLLADVAVTGALSYATGESDNVAEAAWAGATSLIPDAGGTANIKDIGGKLYSHDESTNMITPLGGGKTKGLAYKDGKPVAVDYGSLKGRTSMVDDIVTPVKAIGQSIVDTHQRRESERKPISTVGKSRYSQGTKARPNNAQGWWNQALGALGLQ